MNKWSVSHTLRSDKYNKFVIYYVPFTFHTFISLINGCDLLSQDILNHYESGHIATFTALPQGENSFLTKAAKQTFDV